MFYPEDDDTHLGESWTPTEKEFSAYRAREIELAQANCEFLAREHGMHAVRASNTLHTKHAIREGASPRDPRRVAMGTFMLGFQGMLASSPVRT